MTAAIVPPPPLALPFTADVTINTAHGLLLGSYSLLVTAEGGGCSAVKAFTLVVSGAPPQVSTPTVSPEPSEEGGSVVASAGFSGSGAQSGPYTCTVDYGDGSGLAPGTVNDSTCTGPAHAYDDNTTPPGTGYPVTITVTDKYGRTGSGSTRHVVVNIAPMAMFNAPSPVNEGSPIELVLTDPSDPSGTDVEAGFTYAFDCGDGSSYGPFGSASSVSCPTADNGTRTVGGKIRDKDGGVTEYTDTVVVLNIAPTASFHATSPVDEGSPFTLSFTDPSDPSSADTVAGFTYAFDCGDGSGYHPYSSGKSISCPTEDNGTRVVKGKIRDKDGGETEYTATVSIRNVAPIADFAVTPTTFDEGQSATLAFNNPRDPSPIDTAAGFRYSFDCTGDGTWEATDVTSASYVCSYPDNGIFSAKGRIQDKDGGYTDYTAPITVRNVAPVVCPISGPVDPVRVNTTITTSVRFTDPGTLDTHTAVWGWDDGSQTPGIVSGANGSGTASGSHVYTSPGVYTMRLTVADKDGASGECAYEFVVVYDPNGGFVTGGGWINSPAGAYVPDPTLTGKASFGFVSKYQKGATEPTGETEFQFHAAGMNFHSTSYQWLVIAGAKAQYKGSGTINGSGDYGFMLTGIDGQVNGGGGVDKLRVKIWDKATNTVVYDNQLGAGDDANPTTSIAGGSIVVHSK